MSETLVDAQMLITLLDELSTIVKQQQPAQQTRMHAHLAVQMQVMTAIIQKACHVLAQDSQQDVQVVAKVCAYLLLQARNVDICGAPATPFLMH